MARPNRSLSFLAALWGVATFGCKSGPPTDERAKDALGVYDGRAAPSTTPKGGAGGTSDGPAGGGAGGGAPDLPARGDTPSVPTLTDDASAPSAALPFPPGLAAMEHPEALPLLYPPGTLTRMINNYDPTGNNRDGAWSLFAKYKDENGESVFFDEYGPGCLYRMQMNVWQESGYLVAPKDARIKFYFDGESTPRIDLPFNDFWFGKTAPFTPPFTFVDGNSPRFANSYYPLPFKKRLKVTTTMVFKPEVNFTWYQFTYLKYPSADGVETWKGMSTDNPAVRQMLKNNGKGDPKSGLGTTSQLIEATVPKGATKTVFSSSSPGAIWALTVKPTPYNADIFYNTQIRIYWDNEQAPSVDVPLGSLFGGGGKGMNQSGMGRGNNDYPFTLGKDTPTKKMPGLFYGFDGTKGELYNFYPMPYWSGARIDLVNNSAQDVSLQMDITQKPAAAAGYAKNSAGYFHAKRTPSTPNANGYYLLFEETGRGHVVGMSQYAEAFREDGDLNVYLDESRTPALHGSGSEDDLTSMGWGGSGEYSALWGGLYSGFSGTYRTYLNDSFIFERKIQIRIEDFKWNYSGSNCDTVVYYYKSHDAKEALVLTDSLDVGNAASETAHAYAATGVTTIASTASAYDGYEKNVTWDKQIDDGKAISESSQFTVKTSADNKGVRLRRRLARKGNGIQVTDVYVDGVKVTEQPWYVSAQSSAPENQIWIDADFEIPAAYTKNKTSLTVKLQRVDSTDKKTFNEFFYWVYTHQ